MMDEAELNKWYAYLQGVDATAAILKDLGVDEGSELALLEPEDVDSIAEGMPKVNMIFLSMNSALLFISYVMISQVLIRWCVLFRLKQRNSGSNSGEQILCHL